MSQTVMPNMMFMLCKKGGHERNQRCSCVQNVEIVFEDTLPNHRSLGQVLYITEIIMKINDTRKGGDKSTNTDQIEVERGFVEDSVKCKSLSYWDCAYALYFGLSSIRQSNKHIESLIELTEYRQVATDMVCCPTVHYPAL